MKVRYLIEKPGRDGPRWYWQPTASLRQKGFVMRRLAASTAEEAAALAEEINAQVDAEAPPARSPYAVTPSGKVTPRSRVHAILRGDEAFGGRPYLYVMGSQKGTQKIGISVYPEKRRRDLETASGRRLDTWLLLGGRLSYAKRLEQEAHKRLAEHRREGEWFAVSPQQAVLAVAQALAVISADRRTGAEQESLTSNFVQVFDNEADLTGPLSP